MTLRTSIVRVSFAVVLLLSLSFATMADTIRLKNGSIIKGHIVGFAGGRFTIAIGDGSRLKELTFFANEVDSITFDTPSEKPQLNTATRKNNDNATIVNASSTTPPRVIVTDNTSRPNTTAPNPGKPRSNTSGGTIPPIAWTVKVLADNTANGWTNSGWVLKKGQRIRITGDGRVSLGKGKSSTAAGIGDLQDEQKLLKNVPTGALIAVIGDDNNDFIYVGEEREFVATRDGALFLGLNEGFLDDNSGSFNVKVEILPDQSN